MSELQGSKWWKFDFHTHTPASSDYGAGPDQATFKTRTPREWIEDYMAAGVDCVAVTDHNSGSWIDPLKTELENMRLAGDPRAKNFFIFPGVELSVGGIHCLAIFDPSVAGNKISDLLAVARYNGDTQNAQGYCQETNVAKVCEEVCRLGGIFIPAHVDLTDSGLFGKYDQLSTLRPILDCADITAMELVDAGFTLPALYTDSKVKWATVLGSDSHHPSAPTTGGVVAPRFPGSHFTWVKMGVPSLAALRLALQDGNDFSLIRSDSQSAISDPNQTPDCWIEKLEVSQAKLMGNGTPASFSFSPWMNAVVGGRGSGKSTLVHFVRLASKREDDLKKLSHGEDDNAVLKTFEGFARIPASRHEGQGGLRSETVANLVIRKGTARFKVTWSAGNQATSVETWNETGNVWEVAQSQDVTDRFPLRIFSQGEVGAIADHPEALLSRVDEGIAKADWQARWDVEVNKFKRCRAEVRALKGRLGDKDRLTGQLEDIESQIAKFENAGHTQVRKDFQLASKQDREMKLLFSEYTSLADGISQLAEKFKLSGLPSDLISNDVQRDSHLTYVESELAKNVAENKKALLELRVGMDSFEKDQRERLEKSEWGQFHRQSVQDHQTLVTTLSSQGISDPAAFQALVARREQIEKGLAEIDGVEKRIEANINDASTCLVNLVALRAELRTLRETFLAQGLAGNKFVKITLNAFGHAGDSMGIESEIRSILGCEDSRFADAIGDRERGVGFVVKLHKDLPSDGAARVTEILERVSSWKAQVERAGNGVESELPVRFQTYVNTQCTNRAEFLDQLHVWWPDDSLEVSYSRAGDGTQFVPLSTGSAGQKAAALLAFFLAFGDSPLIIDQPENDLDNHLITHLVVKQMRENKKRRQLIVVTHNPNIVVNGDAEMVHALNFSAGQCRSKAAGALQELPVRTEVCEVMEGGVAALKSRYRRLV